MLVNFKETLKKAKDDKYAIGSFNVYSYETIEAVIEAGNKLNKPVIVSFGEIYLENMSFDMVYNIASQLSKGSKNEVILHLDHCKSIENIKKAIKAGFTSVMFDGSHLPFEENVRLTKEVVELAKAFNVSVEGELGCLGEGLYSNEGGGREIYTDPQKAKEFVELTAIDALAVSIGTIHGMYKGEPKINIELLKEISSMVDIPLVLHGGSGTPEVIIKECIKNGVAKINVNTEISMYVLDKLRQLFIENEKLHLSSLSLKEIQWVSEVVSKYIMLFSSWI